MKHAVFLLGTFALISSVVLAQEITAEPPALPVNRDAFVLAKPGAVKPAGWLREWAEIVAKGYTARMEEVDEEFKRAWREDFQPRGKKLHWSEGTWSCEGGAYWFDGLVKLAYQLDDEAMKALAKRRLDPLLDHMTDHPIGFCWWLDRRKMSHFQEVYDSSDWMVNWVSGAMARPLSAWYAATGDVRAKRALEAALGDDYWNTKFKSQAVDCVPGSVISIPSGAWVAWRETKSEKILAALRTYAEEYARRPTRETYGPAPTNGLERTLGLKRDDMFRLKIPLRHGVVCQETLHSLFVAARLTGDKGLMDSWRKWMDFLYAHAQLPLGTLVMDEEWGHPGPRRGVETCAIAAESWGRINYLVALGEGRFGDAIEQVFFNAVPATMTRDAHAHVYFQTPNRLKAGDCERTSVGASARDQIDYKEKTFPLCCTAGLNRLVPDFVQAMWMTTTDGGVAATLFGPCTFSTPVEGGTFTVAEETDYPFGETVKLRISAAPQRPMPLALRVPSWCTSVSAAVNGQTVELTSKDGFARLVRIWRAGDTVTLRLPMTPRIAIQSDRDETQRDYVCVSAGPILFARGFAEKDANVAAEATFVPVVDAKSVTAAAKLVRRPLTHPFDWPLAAPMMLETHDAAGRPLVLVPYGCTKLRAAMLECAAGAAPGAPELRWYASRSSFACSDVPNGGARLRVLKPDGSRVCETPVSAPRAVVPVGKGTNPLPDGSYRAELVSASRVVCAHDFVQTNYPWFNTSVGRADVLLPGFTPLKAQKTTVEAVGRKYVFGDDGLPKEIWTLGQQILARPISISVGSRKLASGGKFKVSERTDTKVVFRSGLVSGRVEQDGFIFLRCRLPETADVVALEIPVKQEYATFFHAVGDAIRCNPAGVIPSGEGRVFKSRSVKGNGMKLDNFLPYCWIGTDDRGVCFAADTDRGWVHGPDHDAIEIHREKDGTVVLKLNFVAEKGRHAAREIEFALMASPVKPMPKGWRGWVDAYDVAGTRNMLCQASSPTWGSYINGMARYPTFEDWTFVRKMAESAKTGKYDEAYLSDWITRCLDARKNAPHLVPWLASQKDDAQAAATLRAHAGASFKRQLHLANKSNPTLYYYTCDHDPCATLYEMPVMRDEWGAKTQVSGSHQDYAVYYLKKMCENGMQGVYNDNAFLKANTDWVTGGAWFDEKGDLHPSYGLWSLREYARRQIVAMLEAGVKDPWLTIHHTNANVLPIVSFATNLMGMEDKYGVTDFQDRWPRDYIRTVNQGYQAGVFATSIEGPFAMKDAAEKTRVTRTMLATLLPHEVQPTLSMACDHRLVRRVLELRQRFGIGADDCVYTAYYDEKNPVIQANPDVMVSTYRRGNRLLLVIGSYVNETVELPLQLKRGRIFRATDRETDEALPCADGRTSVHLAAHGFALVELTCAK